MDHGRCKACDRQRLSYRQACRGGGAIKKYKDNNDWLSQFLDECCEVGDAFSAKSGDVYNAYRSYCAQVGDYVRSTTDFYTALECAGFERKRSKSARMLFGLQLKSDFLN